MRRPQEIEKDLHQIGTIADITGIFQGIASLRIAQIKTKCYSHSSFFTSCGPSTPKLGSIPSSTLAGKPVTPK